MTRASYFIDHNNGGRTTWDDPRNTFYGQAPPQQKGFSTGAKVAVGAAGAAVLGFGAYELYEHEKEQDRRLEEDERRGKLTHSPVGLFFTNFSGVEDEYRGGYYGGQTTVINEDGGFFGDDRRTVIQSGNVASSQE